jgi:hypothetical protein
VSDQGPILGRGLKFFFPVLLIHSKTLTKRNRKVKKSKIEKLRDMGMKMKNRNKNKNEMRQSYVR